MIQYVALVYFNRQWDIILYGAPYEKMREVFQRAEDSIDSMCRLFSWEIKERIKNGITVQHIGSAKMSFPDAFIRYEKRMERIRTINDD